MADLDVADVIDDPDFWTTFDVMRALETVDIHGRALATQVSDPIDTGVKGAIIPAKSLNIQRLAEGSRQEGAIDVYTRYPLSDGKGSEEAHVVFFDNAHWTVVQVNSFAHYGDGYRQATCDLSDINIAA